MSSTHAGLICDVTTSLEPVVIQMCEASEKCTYAEKRLLSKLRDILKWALFVYLYIFKEGEGEDVILRISNLKSNKKINISDTIYS